MKVADRTEVLSHSHRGSHIHHHMPHTTWDEDDFPGCLYTLCHFVFCLLLQPRINLFEPSGGLVTLSPTERFWTFDELFGTGLREECPSFITVNERVPRRCAERVLMDSCTRSGRSHDEPSVRRTSLLPRIP